MYFGFKITNFVFRTLASSMPIILIHIFAVDFMLKICFWCIFFILEKKLVLFAKLELISCTKI